MAEPDWRAARDDRFEVELVDPRDPGRSLGWLRSIEGISLSMSMDSDTRCSAEVSTWGDDGYLEGARLRIWHRVASPAWSEALFCGYVTEVADSWSRGTLGRTYQLKSSLYAMSADLFVGKFVVAQNGSVLQALGRLMDLCDRPHRVLAGARDRRFTATKVWDVATGKLDCMHELAAEAGDRLSVDGLGYVTVGADPALSPRPAARFTVDTRDPRSVALSGTSIDHTSTALTVPGRYIVTHKDGDSVTVGWVDAPTSLPSSPARRGYVLAASREAKDLTGGADEARRLAQRYLDAAQGGSDEWSVSTLYLPVREGDLVDLRTWDEDGRVPSLHRCEVKSADKDLLKGEMKLVLRGVA